MRVRTNYLISRYILLIFMVFIFAFLTSPIFHFLLSYIISNKLSLVFLSLLEIIIASFAIILALYVFFANQRDLHNKKIEEQINLIEGLSSEINVIKENINWYKQEISNNAFSKLDHPINKIHIENYLTRLNGKFFNKEGFAIISNINDKIFQLNTRVSEGRELYMNFPEKVIPPHKRFNKDYCLSIIKEVLPKIDDLKKELEKQKDLAKKEMI